MIWHLQGPLPEFTQETKSQSWRLLDEQTIRAKELSDRRKWSQLSSWAGWCIPLWSWGILSKELVQPCKLLPSHGAHPLSGWSPPPRSPLLHHHTRVPRVSAYFTGFLVRMMLSPWTLRFYSLAVHSDFISSGRLPWERRLQGMNSCGLTVGMDPAVAGSSQCTGRPHFTVD